MEWDNLNVLTTSIHGSNVVNSTGGIMIQEIKPATDVNNVIPKRCLPLYKRNNTRSLKLKMIPFFHPQRMMKCSLNV